LFSRFLLRNLEIFMPIHDYGRALRAHRDAVSFVQRSGWPIFNWLKTGTTNCLPWTRPSRASLRGIIPIIQEAGVAEALQTTSNMLGAALAMATLASAERKEEKQNDA
jgi:hypothetical protein